MAAVGVISYHSVILVVRKPWDRLLDAIGAMQHAVNGRLSTCAVRATTHTRL